MPIKIVLDLQIDLPRLDNATHARLHSVGIREAEPVQIILLREELLQRFCADMPF